MPVIEYRRGERFDRVITGKEGLFPSRGQTAVRLNVMTLPVQHGSSPAKPTGGEPVPGVQPANDFRATIRHAIEEAKSQAQGQQPQLPNIKLPKWLEETDSAPDTGKKAKVTDWWRYAIIAFIAIQILRALAD